MNDNVQSRIETLRGVRASRLGNERDVRVYLPAGYDSGEPARYPVLYMHVGEHVFEPRKRSGESWEMHRVADRLIGKGLIPPIIIVAVDHKHEEGSSEFFHELSAYPVRCVGELYEHFLIEELKPAIDRRFRTLPEARHTALMGASAAGIATYNIGLRRPDVFGMLGILSPFFVKVDPGTLEETPQYRQYPRNEGQKIWMDIGGAEGFFMPSHVRRVAEQMLDAGWKQGDQLYYYHEMDAAHSERDWGRRAPMPLLHFFGERGKAVGVALEGPDVAGVAGPSVYVNAVVALDNGLRFSDLEGRYRSDNPDLLEVTPTGRLLPKRPGTATVHYEYGGLHTSKRYTVTERLSDTVDVELEIRVPSSTPEDAVIYATFPVPKRSKGLYGGTMRLPRNLTFDFWITRGYNMDETDEDGGAVPYRRLVTDKDHKACFTVRRWSDLPPQTEQEGVNR